MDTDTNLVPPKSNRIVLGITQLSDRLHATLDDSLIPLLVIRTRQLERIAWRRGRGAARALERRCLQAFSDTATRILRGSDVIAHGNGSEDFLAALLSPTRSGTMPIVAADCRTTLARLASAMESVTGLQFETGWTLIDQAPVNLRCAVDDALERGLHERANRQFFTTLAHELRTPLTSIRGYLETLIEEDLDADTTQRFLETARGEALRMGRLLDSLFDTVLQEAHINLQPAAVGQLHEAIAAALDAVAPIAAARRTVISQLACESRSVSIDTDRLTQILINILENAVKHGRDAGRVFVSAADGNEQLDLCVDDDGPGIPREEREAVFAPARRGSQTQASGDGLGLAVVRLLLERSGGGVDVEDSPLGGVRLRLRIPTPPA